MWQFNKINEDISKTHVSMFNITWQWYNAENDIYLKAPCSH